MSPEDTHTRRTKLNELSHRVIGLCMEVHRELGPGLLESAYEECLCYELSKAGLRFERQKPMPLVYETVKLDCGYRVDLLVAGEVIVELKAVDTLLPIHEAQVLTYLRLGGWKVGLLINFNVVVLKDGVRRLVHRFDEPVISAPSASLR